MRLVWVSEAGVEQRAIDELASLASRSDGYVWLDIEQDGEKQESLLAGLGIDHETLREASEKSLIPKVKIHPNCLVLVLQSIDGEGHVFQLGHFISSGYLVTVHDRFNKNIPLEMALSETDAVADKLLSGAIKPSSPLHLAHEIGNVLADHVESILAIAAEEAGRLDRRMREGATGAPEEFLDELFKVRHDLMTIYNRLSQSAQAYDVAASEDSRLSDVERRIFSDLRNRFQRLVSVCDGERRFLSEVLDYHEHRTNARMNVAMERLALIAAVVLPINAVAGIIGMNTIVNSETDVALTGLLFGLMTTMAIVMLWWTKKKHWW